MKEHEILQWLLKREKALLEERIRIEKRIEIVHDLCDKFEHLVLTQDFDDNSEPIEHVHECENSQECSCSDIDTQIEDAKKKLEFSENHIQEDEIPLIENNGEALIQNIDEEDIIFPEINDALSDLENEWKNGEEYEPNYYKSQEKKAEEKPITKKDIKNIEKVIDIEKFKKVKKRSMAA